MNQFCCLLNIMLLFGCSQPLLTSNGKRIMEDTGIIFFTDRNIIREMKGVDMKYYLDNNDKNPDFFIPLRINEKQKLCLEDLRRMLLNKSTYEAYTFTFMNDCNFSNRQSYINQDCNIIQTDSILNNQGYRIFIMPARIKYVAKDRNGVDDLFDNGNFKLKINSNEKINIKISPITYKIIEEAVLRDKMQCP